MPAFFSDPKLGIQGLIDRVDKLKESIPDVYVIDQFINPANPEAHFRSTGMTFWTIVTCTRLVSVCSNFLTKSAEISTVFFFWCHLKYLLK